MRRRRAWRYGAGSAPEQYMLRFIAGMRGAGGPSARVGRNGKIANCGYFGRLVGTAVLADLLAGKLYGPGSFPDDDWSGA